MLCTHSEDSCWVSSGSFPQTVVVSLPHSANIETVQLHSYNGHYLYIILTSFSFLVYWGMF